MSKISEKVKKLSKPASSVKHSAKVAYVVSRAERAELNKRIEPLLRQNQRERDESFEAARDVVVK